MSFGDCAWEQARIALGLRGEHLKLDTAFRAGERVQSPRGDKFAAGCKVGWQVDLEHRRRMDEQAGGID